MRLRKISKPPLKQRSKPHKVSSKPTLWHLCKRRPNKETPTLNQTLGIFTRQAEAWRRTLRKQPVGIVRLLSRKLLSSTQAWGPLQQRQPGLTQDDGEAIKWYSKAAEEAMSTLKPNFVIGSSK